MKSNKEILSDYKFLYLNKINCFNKTDEELFFVIKDLKFNNDNTSKIFNIINKSLKLKKKNESFLYLNFPFNINFLKTNEDYNYYDDIVYFCLISILDNYNFNYVEYLNDISFSFNTNMKLNIDFENQNTNLFNYINLIPYLTKYSNNNHNYDISLMDILNNFINFSKNIDKYILDFENKLLSLIKNTEDEINNLNLELDFFKNNKITDSKKQNKDLINSIQNRINKVIDDINNNIKNKELNLIESKIKLNNFKNNYKIEYDKIIELVNFFTNLIDKTKNDDDFKHLIDMKKHLSNNNNIFVFL